MYACSRVAGGGGSHTLVCRHVRLPASAFDWMCSRACCFDCFGPALRWTDTHALSALVRVSIGPSRTGRRASTRFRPVPSAGDGDGLIDDDAIAAFLGSGTAVLARFTHPYPGFLVGFDAADTLCLGRADDP